MILTYDSEDIDTWPVLPRSEQARSAFIRWIDGGASHLGQKRRSEVTTRAYASFIGGLMTTALLEGKRGVERALTESWARHESQPGGHAPSYQRICAWREFLCLMRCKIEIHHPELRWGVPLHFPVHETKMGSLIAPTTLGNAIHILLHRIPPHTLSSMPLRYALALVSDRNETLNLFDRPEGGPSLMFPLQPIEKHALTYIVRWGWESAVYAKGPEHDYRKAPALPEYPGSRLAMRPVTIADIGSRRWDPHHLTLREDFTTLDRIFYIPNGRRVLFAYRAGEQPEQIAPVEHEIRHILDMQREEQHRSRALKMEVKEMREAVPEGATEDEVTPVIKKDWNLSVNLTGVRTVGEGVPPPKLPTTGPGLFDPPDAPWLR